MDKRNSNIDAHETSAKPTAKVCSENHDDEQVNELLTQHARRLLGTHQWQSALLVVGLPVIHDWFEMGCHLSPSLISIRLTA